MTTMLVIDCLNPQPWKGPKLGTVRKGGKIVPVSYPNDEIIIYQEAVKEYIRDEYPDLEQIVPGDFGLRVTFWFWRSLNYGGQRRNPADATNLQKALEDALQGILYDNDRFNRTVSSHIVMQGRDIEPLIMITAEPYEADPFADVRLFAKAALEGRGHIMERE